VTVRCAGWEGTSQPAHRTVTYREYHIRCCINTIRPPDDEHSVARNMYRIIIINVLCNVIVHQVGHLLRVVAGCTISKTWNSWHCIEPENLLQCSEEPASFPYLKQINPVHVFPSCFFKIHFNIIRLSARSSSNMSLSFKVIYHKLATCHARRIIFNIITCIVDGTNIKTGARRTHPPLRQNSYALNE